MQMFPIQIGNMIAPKWPWSHPCWVSWPQPVALRPGTWESEVTWEGRRRRNLKAAPLSPREKLPWPVQKITLRGPIK